MVTYSGSLVQLYCGQGGAPQTCITGVCGERLQCLDHTGFAPADGACAILVYTAQVPGCSAGELSKVAPGLCALPGLSRSGSGSWVLHKGADSVGSAFCALPRSEQLRRPGAWRVHCPRWAVRLITSRLPAPRFPVCATGAPPQVCRVSSGGLISGCDPPGRCQPSRIPGRLG